MTTKLDKFIIGENIDLCIPTREFARNSDWYKLFNNTKTTRFLEQGALPNTPEEQEDFFVSQKGKRLTLIIQMKDGQFKGVISLSFLDFNKKTCDIALVTDLSVMPGVRLAALEAMALITQHGFENMGMLRISAGQHTLLNKWQQRLELIGYKLEGLHKNKFKKGHESADAVSICCYYKDYLKLCENRGKLWDGKMQERIENLPADSLKDKMVSFFENEREEYYNNIFNL